MTDGFRNPFPDMSDLFTVVLMFPTQNVYKSKHPIVVLPRHFKHAAVIVIDESGE